MSSAVDGIFFFQIRKERLESKHPVAGQDSMAGETDFQFTARDRYIIMYVIIQLLD